MTYKDLSSNVERELLAYVENGIADKQLGQDFLTILGSEDVDVFLCSFSKEPKLVDYLDRKVLETHAKEYELTLVITASRIALAVVAAVGVQQYFSGASSETLAPAVFLEIAILLIGFERVQSLRRGKLGHTIDTTGRSSILRFYRQHCNSTRAISVDEYNEKEKKDRKRNKRIDRTLMKVLVAVAFASLVLIAVFVLLIAYLRSEGIENSTANRVATTLLFVPLLFAGLGFAILRLFQRE